MQDLTEIKKLRRNLNLTQKQLAEKAKVSQSLIAKIESLKIDPTYTKTVQIFNALNSINEKSNISIKEIINKNIISINPETSIIQAIAIMKKHEISQIPVIDNHPIGLITESILLDNLSKFDSEKLKDIKVKQIMDECPPILSLECPLQIITTLLKHYPMILIKDKEKLSGLITKSDILNTFSKK